MWGLGKCKRVEKGKLTSGGVSVAFFEAFMTTKQKENNAVCAFWVEVTLNLLQSLYTFSGTHFVVMG